MDAAEAAVEDVVDQYTAEHKRISERLSTEDVTKDEEQWLKRLQDRFQSRIWQLRGDARKTKCVKFAHKTENPLAIKGDEIDSNPWLLPCKNGVVELKTGRFRNGRPTDSYNLLLHFIADAKGSAFYQLRSGNRWVSRCYEPAAFRLISHLAQFSRYC